jgi:hypothetical protein
MLNTSPPAIRPFNPGKRKPGGKIFVRGLPANAVIDYETR